MNKTTLVLFLGIIMIVSTYSMSSSDALLPENLPGVSQAPSHVRVIEGENIIAYARALYTSPDDPSNHEVPTSDPHDGVAKLILTRTDGTFGCSGTLANDRVHVFTAAHCVTDTNGNYILTSGSATFEGDSQSIVITIDADPAKSKAHPDYDGDFIKGNDIAILKLVTTAPTQIPGIPHATSGSAVGDVVKKSGYGLSGYFSSGTDRSNYPFGTERNGQNTYDAFADTMYVALQLTPDEDFIPGAIYQYDSDDGNSPHDAFGFFFGISDLGLGNAEVLSAPGDSGGPTILNGELVGVTSYGITLMFLDRSTSDCTKERGRVLLDSSCGEFAGDTRVSKYAPFIESVLFTTPQDPTISIGDVTQAEGDSGTTNFGFTVTRSGDTTGSSSVSFATADGTATTADGDYISASGTVSFGTGVTQQTVTVTVNGDTTVESDETFTVNLSTPAGATIADGQGLGIIQNDDTAPPPTLVSISISPVNPSITEGSTQQFTATGTYSDDTNQVLTDVTWSSSLTAVATIAEDGLATGVSVGSTTITANSGGQEDTTILQVTVAPEEPTTASVSSISYSTHGGKDNSKHLDITITIINDFANPVSGASVLIDLFRDGSLVGQGTGITETDGTVTFTLNNASPGLYTTTVTDVTAAGLTWDGVTPSNEFTK